MMTLNESHCRAMGRRDFLGRTMLAAGSLAVAGPVGAGLAKAASVDDLMLQSVTGPIAGSTIKKVLAHEHFYVDFHGPQDPKYMAVDWQVAYGACLNSAQEMAAQDVNLVIEWTNIGVGRNVQLLRNLAQETGITIVFPTGIYKNLVPPAMAGMTVDETAEHFVRELTAGVDHTASRAGFIKISTTEEGTTEQESAIHRAAAIAAVETGCTIAAHSPIAATTSSIVSVLKSEGFDMERFVWGHAQPSSNEDHLKMVDQGATVQFDAISADSDPFFNGPTDDESMLARIETITAGGYHNQVIVSADASVFVNPPVWQYDRDSLYVHRYFAAKLAERLGQDLANKVLRDNVIRAFRRGDKVS